MNDIVVKNADMAVSGCDRGIRETFQFEENVELLKKLLLEVNTYWESTGADKESYVLELEKLINNFDRIKQIYANIFSTIKLYAESVQKTSSTSIE